MTTLPTKRNHTSMYRHNIICFVTICITAYIVDLIQGSLLLVEKKRNHMFMYVYNSLHC